MAFYLVSAVLKPDLSKELERLLREHAFVDLQPFGNVLSRSLRNARIRDDGFAVWEEEDYCTPPLAQERAAALDRFFERLSVAPVPAGEGWNRIRDLPRLFPDLAGGKGPSSGSGEAAPRSA
jgi:hypothetical protein